ncbi:MAG: T9SS type A sorting domain-containing protein [Bacteroidetes bacterium]|nr:T9SS type A sorting domain-containing protein [Bacteroidota bacterium]
MKKLIGMIGMVWALLPALAQEESLSPLPANAPLYYSTRSYQVNKKNLRYLIEKKNIVVKTNTLSLPFVDDFSTNRLRSYKWLENHVTDTFYNVFGTCLAVDGVETISGKFMSDTSWSYSYDLVNKKVDSVANPVMPFTFFGPAITGCFDQPPQTFFYWEPYYTFTFDTNGVKRDSVLVPADETIYYAPVVYFAQGEPGTLWADNYAYVNNTYPVNPPSIGVATLDGLNEYGLPYNRAANSYGSADVLTSKPIDFSGYKDSNDIYLSFYYEAMGLGDFPEKTDSIIVEFKDIGNIWRTVWADTGYSSEANVPNEFVQIFIKVPDNPIQSSFYHNAFQFRFRNMASLYGNNDHWHIDYVRLDKDRQSDSIIRDISFMYDFPTILKEYTHLPADQFTGVDDLADSIVLPVRNLDPDAVNNPPATNFVKGASELYPTPTVVANDALETFNAGPYNFIGVNPASEYTIATSGFPVDSLVIKSRVFIQPNDSRPQNDTLYHSQNFNNLMAYDDGSAERAYGISGLGIKKFGYEFELRQPDTLAAFQIMFAQVEQDVSDLIFNFALWDTLELGIPSFVDSPILLIESKKPLYVDSVNGFATYVLDTPIILSGKYYFGWAQNDTRKIQIGYDLNSTLGKKHMYLYTSATWKKSTITPDGSPMIRFIFDTDFWGTNTFPLAVKDLSKNKEDESLVVYPNPTSDVVYLKGHSATSYEVSVMNLMGQELKREKILDGGMHLGALSNGVYIIVAKNVTTGKTSYHKILKTSSR